MNVIETRRLSKAYGRTRAVDELDMHVAEGDIYGFVGKNGAGKSTAMKMLAGLVTPSSGEFELFRTGPYQRAHDARALRRGGSFSTEFSRVGALIETPGLLFGASAMDNLMIKALSLGVVQARQRCRELIELVGLGDAGQKNVKGFSLGMKQRLGLALALVGSPDLLLLDEPFNGLDAEATREMRSLIVQLNRERGVTVLISSHVLDQLDRLSTRYGVIHDGHMVREFSHEDLHRECASFLRIRTAEPERTLAILEERLPNAALRAEPDRSLIVPCARSGEEAAGAQHALPRAEDVARILFDSRQLVLELSRQERDIEEFFVELMGDADEEENAGPATPYARLRTRTRAGHTDGGAR